jgi:hypothetical protein
MLKLDASAFYNASVMLERSRALVQISKVPATVEMSPDNRNVSLALMKEFQSSLLILGTKVTALISHDLLLKLANGPLTFQ